MSPDSKSTTLPDSPLDAVSGLERELSLPDGFYIDLLKEDDWSFIIKLHSLFEAAITQLLVESLGKTELYTVLSRLEISNEYTGKIAFCKSLGLVDENARKFIHKLSALRNDFVHNINTVNVSLGQYTRDANKLKSFVDSFGPSVDGPITIKGRKLSDAELIREYPKLAIWRGGLNNLWLIYSKSILKRQDQSLSRLKDAIADRVMNAAQDIISQSQKS